MKRTLTIVLLIIVSSVLFGSVGYYLGFQTGTTNSKQSQVTNDDTQVQLNESSNAETDGVDQEEAPTSESRLFSSTEYGISFNHPGNTKVEERVPGFFVLTGDVGSSEQGYVSIDARQEDIFKSYNNTVSWINKDFDVKEKIGQGGWEVYRVVGKEGQLTAQELRIAIKKYKTGVIEVESFDVESLTEIFNQIIDTFEVSN